MPFCQNCGAQVAGAFCAQCGSPIAGAGGTGGAASPPPQGAYAPPPQGAYQQPGYQQPGYAQPAVAAGLTDNVAGFLCYLFGLITGVIFLVLEPYNKKPNIRFHAFQSIFLNVAWLAIYIVLGILTSVMVGISGFGMASMIGILIFLLDLAGLALWICLMVFAYQGKTMVLPIIGPFAQQMASK